MRSWELEVYMYMAFVCYTFMCLRERERVRKLDS